MKTIILLALFAGILTSCTPMGMLSSDVRPSEVKDLQSLTPFSYIYLIEKENKSSLNDTLSDMSQELLQNVLTDLAQNQNRLPITGELETTADTLIRNQLEREVEYLCLTADRTRKLGDLAITPVLDSLLEMNGKRFGLITVAAGFTRQKGNYGGQIAKGIVVGVLTLGLFAPVPIKSNSTIYMMIVDAEKDNIAFFNKAYVQDKEPLDENVIRKQIDKVFENYFWNKM